jgi:hypothetical protein
LRSNPEKKISPPLARRFLASLVGVEINRSTFHRWIASGLIPSTKLVSRYYIRVRDILKFAEEATW